MNLIYVILTCILSFLYVFTLYNIPVIVAGVRHLRRSSQSRRRILQLSKEELPAISVVVPVKNEERVVGRLLEALLRLDYPQQKKEIIIVEDGSLDKTVEICKEYVKQHHNHIRLLQKSKSNGKAAALNYAIKHAKGDIIAMFDADNVPEQDILLRVVQYFEDQSVAAVQGTTRSINADENVLTKFVSYEEAVRFEVLLRGKDVLNLFVPLTGSCQFIRRNAIEEVGKWDETSLSEDTDMSVRLMEKGYNIRYAPDVQSWQENPSNLTQLVKQRTRWFRGCMEVAVRYGSLITRLDRKSIDAEFTLAGPYMLALCLIGYFMAILTFFVPIRPDPIFTIMAQFLSLLTAITLLITGIGLIYLAKPRKMANLLCLPFIYVYWSAQTFMASYALIQIILKRPRKWTKTVRTGATDALKIIDRQKTSK